MDSLATIEDQKSNIEALKQALLSNGDYSQLANVLISAGQETQNVSLLKEALQALLLSKQASVAVELASALENAGVSFDDRLRISKAYALALLNEHYQAKRCLIEPKEIQLPWVEHYIASSEVDFLSMLCEMQDCAARISSVVSEQKEVSCFRVDTQCINCEHQMTFHINTVYQSLFCPCWNCLLPSVVYPALIRPYVVDVMSEREERVSELSTRTKK